MLMQEGPVHLRLEAARGESLEYRHEGTMTLDLPPELGGHVTTRTSLTLRQTAEEVTPDTLFFMAAITRLHFSSEPPIPGAPLLEGLRSPPFRLAVTRSGRVARIEPQSVEGGGPDPGTQVQPAQLEGWLQRVGFPVLPELPVAVGESWSDTVPLAAMGVPGLEAAEGIRVVRTTTLERVQAFGRSRVAELRSKMKLLVAGRGDPSGPSARVSGSVEQLVRFDVTRGRFLASRGTVEFAFELPQPGAPALSLSGSGTTRTSLAEP